MKITIEKKELVNALKTLCCMLTPPKKKDPPVFTHAQIDVSEKETRIMIRNKNVWLSRKVVAKTSGTGRLILPIRRFWLRDLISQFPTGEIVIEANGKDAQISHGEIEAGLLGLTPDNAEDMPEFTPSETATIPQGMLKAMLSKVAFAMSEDANRYSRYSLCGALLEIKAGTLTTAATSGGVMSVAQTQLVDGAEDLSVNIPRDTVKILLRTLTDEGDASVSVSKDDIQIDGESFVVCSKLNDGKFPNCDAVFPKDLPWCIEVDKPSLLSALRRLIAFGSYRCTQCKLTISGSDLIAETLNPATGKIRETIHGANGVSESQMAKNAVAINPDFLRKMALRFDSENIVLKMKDGNTPVTVEPDKQGEITQRMIVMPIRL